MQEQANEPNEMQNLLNELQIAKLQAEIAELQAKAKKYASQGDLADSVTLAQSLELQEQALSPEQTSHNKSMQKGGIDLR